MPITIRPAQRRDLEVLGRLGGMLMRTHFDYDRRRFLAPGEDAESGYGSFLGTILDSPDDRLLVAEQNGAVVGYVWAAREPLSWPEERFLHNGSRPLCVFGGLQVHFISRSKFTLVSALSLTLAGCAPSNGQTDVVRGGEASAPVATQKSGANPCTPLQRRPPNAAQRPTFAGQTRICGMTTSAPFDVVVLAKGLEHPWAVEPLPDGELLVTERPGRMRIITAAGQAGAPIAGLPKVDARGQGGLLDVALSPSFATDRTIFWSYSEPRQGGNATSVARGVLSTDRARVDQVRVIFRAMPTHDGRAHFGSRLVFGRDGTLFVTLGERSIEIRPQAQHLDSHMGKIIRINPDGSVPSDNPFVGRADAKPEIWDIGHRNVQSAALDAQGRLWTVEHGPQGGDEVNLIEKGKNYGWPVVTFGQEYSGRAISTLTTRRGYVDPIYYWDPVIAPSGAQFYNGDAFPEWRGNLFIGGMNPPRLVRLKIEKDRVIGEEHLLEDRDQRIRDVRQGPDGALYIVTDENNGELWKIVPRR